MYRGAVLAEGKGQDWIDSSQGNRALAAHQPVIGGIDRRVAAAGHMVGGISVRAPVSRIFHIHRNRRSGRILQDQDRARHRPGRRKIHLPADIEACHHLRRPGHRRGRQVDHTAGASVAVRAGRCAGADQPTQRAIESIAANSGGCNEAALGKPPVAAGRIERDVGVDEPVNSVEPTDEVLDRAGSCCLGKLAKTQMRKIPTHDASQSHLVRLCLL